MRKLWSVLLAAAMLFALCVLAVQAEKWDWDDEEEAPSIVETLKTPAPMLDPDAPAPSPAPTASPAPTPAPQLQADGSQEITITAVGDVTIGKNVQYNGQSIFEKELNKQNGDINFIFRNVKEIFASDDLTIANFEGVLAEKYTIPSSKRNNDYLFLL